MSYEGETLTGRLENQQLEGQPPDRMFVADGVAEDGDGEVVYTASRLVTWRIGGPKVDESSLQRYADRQLERLVTDLENADGFDPTSIT